MSEDYEKNKKNVLQCSNINRELIDVKTKLKHIIDNNRDELNELISINSDINNNLNFIKNLID